MRMASYSREHQWMRSFQNRNTCRLWPPSHRGVAPELALSGEGVWGYTGCRSQTALTVHLEQLRVEVELCAVVGQIDGDVPHNANSLLIGVVLQVEPLLIEDVLKEGVEGHPLGSGTASFGHWLQSV